MISKLRRIRDNMYRVVLIDDENIIVEGLKNVINWSAYHCEIVGTANDAEAGEKIIRQLKPHIVFTDIRMPGQDGLSMVSKLRSEYPDMLVTILTGYRDFSYAQEAIRIGVTRFLLKPSKLDEIEEALKTMVAYLDEQRKEEEHHQEDEDNQEDCAGALIVKQALEYMESAYQQKLTLQDVADRCFVSQWHLSKLLNRYAEKSFYDILNKIRVDQAKELLADPKLKIGEISEMVGYSDTAHFARTFKKLEGKSANEYRNSL